MTVMVVKADTVSHQVAATLDGRKVVTKASVQRAEKSHEDLARKIAKLMIRRKIARDLTSLNGRRKKVHRLKMFRIT